MNQMHFEKVVIFLQMARSKVGDKAVDLQLIIMQTMK